MYIQAHTLNHVVRSCEAYKCLTTKYIFTHHQLPLPDRYYLSGSGSWWW